MIDRFGEILRKKTFWSMDRLSGGKIHKDYENIYNIFNNPEIADEYTNKRLKHLIEHAGSFVPFYMKFKNCLSIQEYPIITKDIIKNNYSDFISEKFNSVQMKKVKTSGSQGKPFIVYHDKRKACRKKADLIFFNKQIGNDVGDKHALIRTKNKSPLELLLQNEVLIIASKRDQKSIQQYYNILKKKNISFIIGHPSIMVALAESIKNGKHKDNTPKIRGFIAIAEPLYEYDRIVIEETFYCQVLGRYSSEEFGIIAHELPGDTRYHWNIASLYTEMLALDSDLPVKAGEPGRIVVTDLFSYGMPLIRYDTGDIGVQSKKPSSITGGPVFERIEGRVLDIIQDTDGNSIFPLSLYDQLTDFLVDFPKITDYQLIQNTRYNYTLRLKALSKEKMNIEPLRNKLVNILGPDAKVDIEITDNLEILASGKKPFIINRLNKSDHKSKNAV